MNDEINPKMTWDHIRYEDILIHILVNMANPSWMDFEVHNLMYYDDGEGSPYKFEAGKNRATKDFSESKPLITGSIKFDGCCHSDLGHIHGCSREEMTRLGKVYDILYDLAMERMPGSKEFLERI